MQGLGNHRGWSAVVGFGYLNGLAWLLALALIAALAAQAFWATQASESVDTSPRHVGDPRAAAAQIVQHLQRTPAQSRSVPGQEAAGTSARITLVGLATGFDNDRGFALFMTEDGAVHSVLAGETGPDGHTLLGIHADHVIVERNGISRKIALTRPTKPDADADSVSQSSPRPRTTRTP